MTSGTDGSAETAMHRLGATDAVRAVDTMEVAPNYNQSGNTQQPAL